jgi:hypothetical protein
VVDFTGAMIRRSTVSEALRMSEALTLLAEDVARRSEGAA